MLHINIMLHVTSYVIRYPRYIRNFIQNETVTKYRPRNNGGWSKMRKWQRLKCEKTAKYFSHFTHCHFCTFAFRTFAVLKCENANVLFVKKCDSSVLYVLRVCSKVHCNISWFAKIFCGHCPRPAMGRQSPYADLALYTPPVFEVERPHGLIMEPPLRYSTVYSLSFTDNLTWVTYK